MPDKFLAHNHIITLCDILWHKMSNLIFTPPLPTAGSRPLPAVVFMVQAVVHYRHHTKDSFTTLTLQTNQTERPNFTNGLRPTNYYQSMLLESYSQ